MSSAERADGRNEAVVGVQRDDVSVRRRVASIWAMLLRHPPGELS